jgi:transposase-like protein
VPALLGAALAVGIRALARGAAATHDLLGRAAPGALVISPSWLVPRRRDGAEVIGEALRLAAGGVGHRTIARRLGRPPGTVRGWLRAARRRAESLRACATCWTGALDPEIGAVIPAGSSLGDAVEAIMLAVRAWVLRFGGSASGPWELAVCLTGGLLHGQLRLPP